MNVHKIIKCSQLFVFVLISYELGPLNQFWSDSVTGLLTATWAVDVLVASVCFFMRCVRTFAHLPQPETKVRELMFPQGQRLIISYCEGHGCNDAYFIIRTYFFHSTKHKYIFLKDCHLSPMIYVSDDEA